MEELFRVLVVAPDVCRYDEGSGDQRLLRMLGALSGFAAVDFLIPLNEPTGSDPQRRYWAALRERGVNILSTELYTHCLRKLLSGRIRYDWVLFEFWHEAARFRDAVELLRVRCPTTRIAVDTVDVHYLRESAAFRLGAAYHGAMRDIEVRKRKELAVYEAADLVLVVSAEDAASLTADGITTERLFVPNIVTPQARSPARRSNELLFIGGFRHPPNVQGIRWFVSEVYPLVRARVPDVRLKIVGSDAPAEIRALGASPGVDVLGFVEDTRAVLDCAAVSVAPLLFGAGMKGKVTEALSFGVPVVTTSVGAQGLGAASQIHLMIADRAEEFADAVVQCLRDPVSAADMGRRGQELVVGLCGHEPVRARLQNALQKRHEEVMLRDADHRGLPSVRHLTVLIRCTMRPVASRLRRSLRRVSRAAVSKLMRMVALRSVRV
jgi:O-antigen biosynthesis protein